jgi:hypothetical protein
MIARRATRSPLAGVIATLAFSLSAFGLYYQRRVILDNIAAFWMLLSIYLLTSERLTLLKVWASAVALAISILSKELTVFLIPVMTYFVWWRSHRSQRTLATTGWFIIVCSICSTYVLMALLKGELFPPGTAFSPGGDHVSLLGTLMFHAGRERDGGLLYWNSDFWNTYRTWAVDEPLLTLGGSLAMLISALLLPWQRMVGILGLATLSLFAFLARGGITLGFYLVPLLPLLAINLAAVIALMVQLLQGWLTRGPRPIAALRYGLPAVALVGGMSGLMMGYQSASLGYSSNPWSLWNNKQAQVQSIAVNWARENLPPDSTIIIDQSMWIELQGPPDDGPRFTRAHYYWKVDRDPEITDGIFESRWQEADYLITTLQLVGDATRAKLDVTNTALENSVLVARFDTGGWPVEVRRVVPQPATADAAPDSTAGGAVSEP